MSLFDSIAKTTFSIVEQIMGDVAIWVPSLGGEQQTAKVLYNNPESKQTLGDVDKYEYSPYNYWFEYYEGQFPGLKSSIDSGNIEIVTINNIQLNIREVTTKYDGKNYVAFGELAYIENFEGIGNARIGLDVMVYE